MRDEVEIKNSLSPLRGRLDTLMRPGLTFSLLAKVFAKGKMFWYL